jgi:hypothetical protein
MRPIRFSRYDITFHYMTLSVKDLAKRMHVWYTIDNPTPLCLLEKGIDIMDLEKLLRFCAVVDYGSMSKAAETLYCSQPALSKQIIALEKEVGYPLFDRNGKKCFTYCKVHTCDFGDEARLGQGEDFYTSELDTSGGKINVTNSRIGTNSPNGTSLCFEYTVSPKLPSGFTSIIEF